MFSALGLRGAQQPISLGQRHLNNRRWGQLRYAETGRQLNDPVKGSANCSVFMCPLTSRLLGTCVATERMLPVKPSMV